ncbi:MAG: rane protein [Bacteriovoracaceae bacterium]|nr:rane protein [Bacteriovoracaceae bacterium]
MSRTWLVTGCLFAFLSVAMGAFATHALRERLDTYALSVFQTGATYLMYHALALIALGLANQNSRLTFRAGYCFIFGSAIFSGSLFAIALSGNKSFGMITPVGGTFFLLGWIFFSLAAFRFKGNS